MPAIFQNVNLKTIFTVLLVLSSLWLLRIIFSKEKQYLFRAVILFLLFLMTLVYFQQSDSEKISLSDFSTLFAPKSEAGYTYTVERGHTGKLQYTRYVFENPKPKLKLVLDENGKYFHLRDISSINRILSQLDLPLVHKGAQELSSLTGSDLDKYHYRWDDYPPGILMLEKTSCQGTTTFEKFHCVANITITRRY